MGKSKARAIIISGGTADADFIRYDMEGLSYDLLIAADKGLDACYLLKIKPDVMLGDYDSVDSSIYSFFERRGVENIKFPAEKNQTDTELAVRYALDHDMTDIILYGATGTRLDHTLANIYLLRLALKRHVNMQIRDAYNRIRLVEKQCEIIKKEAFGHTISLLPVTVNVKDITLKGFQYPLEHGYLKQGMSLGISNVITAEQARIDVGSGVLLLVESRD